MNASVEETIGMKRRRTNWNATLTKRTKAGAKWMRGSKGGRAGTIRLFIEPRHLHPSATRWNGIQTILSVTRRTRAFITTADCSILLKDRTPVFARWLTDRKYDSGNSVNSARTYETLLLLLLFYFSSLIFASLTYYYSVLTTQRSKGAASILPPRVYSLF